MFTPVVKTVPSYKTAKQIIEEDIPPIEYIVDILIAKGVVILSAKSKIGKSWLALQLAVAVASGSNFLGFNTTQGTVLYIDLENAEAVAQSRLIKVLDGAEPPENLYIVNKYSTMNDTFIDDLCEFLDTHTETSLVIVDVFQKIKRPKKSSQTDYEDMYEHLSELKAITDKYNISLMLIMHNRKMVDQSDPFSNIIGSTAIMGASDETIVIHKQDRSDKDAKLSITGRTVQENEFVIKFNKPLCKWEFVGNAEEVAEEKEKQDLEKNAIAKTILKLMNQGKGYYKGTTSDIIKASQYFQGCRIYGDSKSIGKKMKKVIELLKKYESISYEAITNGNATVTHEFFREFS